MSNTRLTFCIPSNNNLKYLKGSILSIRKNARYQDHEIIIFVDRDNDGTVDWLKNNQNEYSYQYYINPDLNNTRFGIAKAYDYCIEKSNTDIFMIFHADMILGIDADYHALKYLQPRTAVCSTRIEPSLFSSNGEKIIKDLGLYPEKLDNEIFDKETLKIIESNIYKTTTGIFAPWMMHKKDFLAIGGHDHNLGSFKEDSDIFNRMKINNFQLVQSWSSIVYHFCGRGGRFEDDNFNYNLKYNEEKIAERKFIRKWGSAVRSTPSLDPIVNPKYNAAIIVTNFDKDLIKNLEPFYDDIYISSQDIDLCRSYINQEEKHEATIFSKFHTIDQNLIFENIANDIIVFIEKEIDQQDYQILTNIHDVVSEINSTGNYQINHIKLVIKRIKNTLKQYLINE